MGKENFRMFGRLGHGNRIWEAKAKAFDIFERLSTAIGPIDKPKVVKMDVSAHVGIGDLLRKNGEQGILLLDPFSQSEIGGFRTMRDIGILFIRMENELVHVVEGHAETGVHSAGLF
jgi:hypothetical protein